MKYEERIQQIAKKFRILRGWSIGYCQRGRYRGQSVVHTNIRGLLIYPFGKRKMPRDYFLHEILHAALQALLATPIKEQREAEECLVQDICHIWAEPSPPKEPGD